jgi:hypothetical protein
VKKDGKTPRPSTRRSRIVEPDFGVAVERACKALDEARSSTPAELHHSAKVLRAMITASELDDEDRLWS